MDERLIAVLACPKCKQKVKVETDKAICEGCKVWYPINKIEDRQVPIMLSSEAHNV